MKKPRNWKICLRDDELNQGRLKNSGNKYFGRE